MKKYLLFLICSAGGLLYAAVPGQELIPPTVNSHIYEDNSGNMTFLDASEGPVTLTTLANPAGGGGGSSVFPATAAASFPFGASFSTVTVSTSNINTASSIKLFQVKSGNIFNDVIFGQGSKNGTSKGSLVIQASTAPASYDSQFRQTTIQLVPVIGTNGEIVFYETNGSIAPNFAMFGNSLFFYDSAGSLNYTALASSPSIASPVTFILPPVDESPGGYLRTDGAGGLSLVTSRVTVAIDSTTITPNTDVADMTYQSNSQSTGTLSIKVDAGTPVNGRKWIMKIKSTNTMTFSFNAQYVGSSDLALPTTTTGSGKIDYYGFIYDTVNSKWDLISQNQGF